MSQPRFIVEYVRQSDLDVGDPAGYTRHSSADTEEEVEALLRKADPEGDLLVTSITTIEEFRAFLAEILADPECSIEALAKEKQEQDEL